MVIEGSIERDRAEGERRSREDTHHRDEPEARPDIDRELSEPHEPERYPASARRMHPVLRWTLPARTERPARGRRRGASLLPAGDWDI